MNSGWIQPITGRPGGRPRDHPGKPDAPLPPGYPAHPGCCQIKTARALTFRHRPVDPSDAVQLPIHGPIWLEPFPDEWLAPASINPEARYDAYEGISLAFLVALQSCRPASAPP
jgi:hypothetical protein